MENPTKIDWTDATTNTDGSAIDPSEITGYMVGIRSTTAAGSAAGTYPYTISAPSSATEALLSALSTALPADTYVAAVQSQGPTASDWSAESNAFTIAAPLPVPNAPSGVVVS